MTAIRSFASQHPRITAWIVLAIGMVIILVWASKDVGLLPTQLLALVIATIALAGLCVWIIGWEDSADETETPAPNSTSNSKPTKN
ncbi:MAG TPA: hypothetical protein VFD70_12980 [Anaerolineae bacterium]|nr:hypothetical protein [Anaerolineae bacterium]